MNNNIYYILACILPFIFTTEVGLLYYFGCDRKFLGFKLILNTLLTTILLVYNIHNEYFYELIIPIFFIIFNISLGIYLTKKPILFKRGTRLHFRDELYDIYNDNL